MGLWHSASTGSGSNQYRSRCSSLRVASPLGTSLPTLCGQIWGNSCPEPVRPPHWAHGRHPDRLARLVTAGSTDTAGVLNLLARDRDPEIRRRVASNPATPPATLGVLSRDRARAADYDKLRTVRHAVAGNPAAPPAVLLQLCEQGRTEIAQFMMRQAVAGNPNCPPELLGNLFHRYPELLDLRLKLAGNPNTPPETLLQLLQDTSEQVQQTAAGNPALPRHTLAMWQLTHR